MILAMVFFYWQIKPVQAQDVSIITLYHCNQGEGDGEGGREREREREIDRERERERERERGGWGNLQSVYM